MSGMFRSIKVVAWSFLGIRSREGYQNDLARVNPLHVVLIGLLGAVLLVAGLVGLVRWVVAS